MRLNIPLSFRRGARGEVKLSPSPLGEELGERLNTPLSLRRGARGEVLPTRCAVRSSRPVSRQAPALYRGHFLNNVKNIYMARPPKKGLDYFPLDVAVFDDAKLCLLRSEFGIKGEYIYLRLLCRIYKEGYCIPWNNDEAALFALSIGQNTSPAMVNEVIQGCLRRSLFDKRVHGSFGILTAKGIQERYVFICKQLKRKPNITPQLDCCGFTQSAEEEVLEPAVSSAKSLIIPEET